MAGVSFSTDDRTETWLKARGVPFRYIQNVRLTQLVPNWANINQGRPDGAPKDESLIEKYMFSMQSGAIFPAPLIAQSADGFEPLDGIQRLCAAQLNDQSIFNAYLIDTDNAAVRTSVRVCANTLNGSSPSQDWTIARVVDILIDIFHFKPADCALWSGIPEHRIQQEINSREAGRWMAGAGIDTTVKPANQKGFRSRFYERFELALLNRPDVARHVVKLVKTLQDMRATNSEADELLEAATDIKIQRGVEIGAQFAARFDEVLERPEVKQRMGGRRKRHPIDNCVAQLAGAVTVLRSTAEEGHHADEKQSAEIAGFVDELKNLARRIIPKDQWGPLAYGPRRE